MSAGVYQIRNTNNGHTYIGSTNNLDKRRNEHFNLLRLNAHKNKYLQNAYNKYGKEAFKFEILFKAKHPTNMILFEQYYLDTQSPEYNIALIANSSLGVKRSEETKLKISQALKGKFTGEANPLYGKRHSSETRQKISQSLKGKSAGSANPSYGKKPSIETRRKISEALKGKFSDEANPFYGKKHSAETRRKISEACKGRKLSTEVRLKMSESRKGKPQYHSRKLSDDDVRQIRSLLVEGKSQSELARLFNINRSSISQIKGKQLYKNID